jgi:hypothetical protein
LFLWQSKTAIVRPQRASADLLGEIRAVDFDPDARALFGLFGRICLVTRAFLLPWFCHQRSFLLPSDAVQNRWCSLDTRDSSEWYTVCMSASLVEKDRMFNTFSLPVQIYAHIHRACNGRTVKYRV